MKRYEKLTHRQQFKIDKKSKWHKIILNDSKILERAQFLQKRGSNILRQSNSYFYQL
jgi:hypothetical protein